MNSLLKTDSSFLWKAYLLRLPPHQGDPCLAYITPVPRTVLFSTCHAAGIDGYLSQVSYKENLRQKLCERVPFPGSKWEGKRNEAGEEGVNTRGWGSQGDPAMD